MAWVVELTGSAENQQKAKDIYGGDYFPRRFHYKKDADSLAAKLARRYIHTSIKKAK